jgi:hypothetical protein
MLSSWFAPFLKRGKYIQRFVVVVVAGVDEYYWVWTAAVFESE